MVLEQQQRARQRVSWERWTTARRCWRGVDACVGSIRQPAPVTGGVAARTGARGGRQRRGAAAVRAWPAGGRASWGSVMKSAGRGGVVGWRRSGLTSLCACS